MIAPRALYMAQPEIEGRVPVPDKPGLGVELDPEAVRRYRLDGARSWVARRGRAR
jgi:L-alanine-DL-glutamate epimerase-like enolase superfamily enzyme